MLDLDNGKVVLEADLFTISAFRIIWERDKTPNKEEAIAFISYIFHFYNPRSPYFNYTEALREPAIIEREFPDHLKSYVIAADSDLKDAAYRYRELLNLSPYRAVIEMAKNALQEIGETLKSAKSKATTKLAQLPKLTNALNELKKAEAMVSKDEINSNVKGERIVKSRER